MKSLLTALILGIGYSAYAQTPLVISGSPTSSNSWVYSIGGTNSTLPQPVVSLLVISNSIRYHDITNYYTIVTYSNNVTYTTNIVYSTNYVYTTNIVYVTNNVNFSSNNIVVAASGSYNDVSAAVNIASSIVGSTVLVPGGSNVWNNELILNGVSLISTNSTSIVFNDTNYSGIYINSQAGSTPVTISNFVFDLGTNANIQNMIGIDGSNYCFRLTKCLFKNLATQPDGNIGIKISGINNTLTSGPFGLIDHCNFYLPQQGESANLINTMCNGNVSHYGWSNSMTWGTTNTVMIEACNFYHPTVTPIQAAFESMGGGRIAMRYCNVTNVPVSYHGANSGAKDSTLQVEIYNNNFVDLDSANQLTYVISHRGGTGVIYSNTLSYLGGYQYISTFAIFWVECAQSEYNNWSYENCTNLLTYPADYPAYEQVGRGVTSPNVIGSMPVYCWSNSVPSNLSYCYSLGQFGDAAFITQGNDIFTNQPMPGYTPLIYPHPQDK